MSVYNIFFQVSMLKLAPKSDLSSTTVFYIGVWAGGGGGWGQGGLQPPQSLGNSDFLGSERKFGQSQFLKTSPCSFNYFKDLNINLK